MMPISQMLPPDSCRVYTGPNLARGMVMALGDASNAEWLDPCVGNGAFLEALAQLSVAPKRIRAIDIDPTVAANDGLARTLRGHDFISWAGNTQERFDRVVANPPYVSISRLPPKLQKTVSEYRSRVTASQVSKGSNYWCAFLLASLDLLKPGGSLCFVLPAGWDYAAYASWFRENLTRFFRRIDVHRSQVPMFPSVQEGSVVLVAVGFGTGGGTVHRQKHDSPERLIKFLPHPVSIDQGSDGRAAAEHTGKTVRLGEIVSIRLGGVTGDADYFLLSESRRQQLELPMRSVRPILTKARHLCTAQIDRTVWETLRERDERIWLFNPPDELLTNAAVKRYLELDELHGGCRRDRYKIRSRSPWYRVPIPERIEGFVSGMSKLGPWICLNRTRNLAASNTLYTIEFRRTSDLELRCAWSLSVLTTLARSALARVGRVYPDGLVKHEPGDLVTISVPEPHRIRGSEAVYSRAVRVLLSGRVDLASEIADDWLKVSGSKSGMGDRSQRKLSSSGSRCGAWFKGGPAMPGVV